MPDAPADAFAAARANLRDTIKWLATVLAGVAAVAAGSSPLTALGALSPSDTRFQIATAALAVALVCLVAGVGVFLDLLLGDTFYLEEARNR